MKTNNRKTYG